MAPYATNKIWLKPNAEQQFLYGHNVTKAGLGRITEDTEKYQGVVVYSMNDLPLGMDKYFPLIIKDLAKLLKH